MIRPYLERLRMVPMILVMGTIFFLSHQSGDTIDLGDIPGMDKLGHMAVYGLLAATVILAHRASTQKKYPRRVCVVTVVVCLLYGLSDELHQSFVPERCVSGADVLADVIGATLVAACWFFLEKRHRAKKILKTRC